MSTRSYIGIQKDDKVEFIYCHFDGYLEGVGATLLKSFNNSNKAKKLIALGDIRGIDEDISKIEKYDEKSVTVDLKEYLDMPRNVEETNCIEYFYLFKDNKWQYATEHQQDFKSLEEELKMNNDNEITYADLQDCVSFYEEMGLKAFISRDETSVILEMDDCGLDIEVSKDEILQRAEQYREENKDSVDDDSKEEILDELLKAINAGEIADFEDLINHNNFADIDERELLNIRRAAEAYGDDREDFVKVMDESGIFRLKDNASTQEISNFLREMLWENDSFNFDSKEIKALQKYEKDIYQKFCDVPLLYNDWEAMTEAVNTTLEQIKQKDNKTTARKQK